MSRPTARTIRPTPKIVTAMTGLSIRERVVVKCLLFPMLPKSQRETAMLLGTHWKKVGEIERVALQKVRAVLEREV